MSNRLKELFTRFLDSNISPEEKKELMGMALEAGLQDELRQVIKDAWEHTGEDEDITDAKAEELMQKIFAETPESKGKLMPIRKRTGWRSIAAAAAIVIAIGAGAYYAVIHKPGKPAEIVKVPELPADVKPPRQPGKPLQWLREDRVFRQRCEWNTGGNIQLIRLMMAIVTAVRLKH